ncbi:MAG: hypothetical protein E7057_03550 [Lentisphaerae bacterium]|nr:hypothetical protein [Lentisphaerota bacterium]
MKLDFRIDWGYQSLYTRASYHPVFIWDGCLKCHGGTIDKSFHLAYPYVVFGPGHCAVEEPLASPMWQSRTQYTFDGVRFEASVSDDTVFDFQSQSCSFKFTVKELLEKKRLTVPVGPKYLNCNVIVTLTGHFWFQPSPKENQIVFDADDFKNIPVRSWARMRTAWIAPGKSLTFTAELDGSDADFIERIMHLVIMAAPAEYTPGNEQQVQDFFPLEIRCDGNTVAKTTRFLRHHDTRMQLLEDEWVRFKADPGRHVFEIVNHHRKFHLLLNRIVLQNSTHDHLDLSLPEWLLVNEKAAGKVFAVQAEYAEITVGSQKIGLKLQPGWNEFYFTVPTAGCNLPVVVKSTEKEYISFIKTVYDLADETPEVTVGYDMTTVPHDDNGGMDWLLDYTSRTRLGNMVVFRNFLMEDDDGNVLAADDASLERWGNFCRTHHIYVEAATDFDSGALVKGAGNMLHSVGKHEATFAVYGRQPQKQWQADDMKSALEHFICFMRTEINRAKKVSPVCAFGDPSGAARYVYMAGADFIRTETMVPHTQHVCSLARPAAEIFSDGTWGVHIAIQHAMQPYFENHLGVYYLSLMQPYLMGANMIYEEDSLFELFKEERQAWDDKLTKGKRDMTRDFYRFVKTHPRQGKIIRKIAFIEGRYAAPFHGFLCNEQDKPECAVWGMFGNDSPTWQHLQPEKCRHILDVLMPGASTHPLRQKADKIRFFFSGTPFGDFDEVPAEAAEEYLSDYSLLLHLGWNTMIEEDYEKLKHFVASGGTLLIGIPQFSKHLKRDFLLEMNDLDLYNAGDLSELCGVRVRGAGMGYSGRYSCSADFGLDKDIELSALPSERFDEDAPCRLADIELAGAKVQVRDAVSGKPLVTEFQYGKGKVYLINTYAYAGHNILQQLSAALVKKLAAENLPECYVKSDSNEIFWNVRQIASDSYAINLLNTDWTSAGNEIYAEICAPNGISAKVCVKERQLCTVCYVCGKMLIPSSPEVYINVGEKGVTVHGSGKNSIKVISAEGKTDFIEVDLSGYPQKEIIL